MEEREDRALIWCCIYPKLSFLKQHCAVLSPGSESLLDETLPELPGWLGCCFLKAASSRVLLLTSI